jgi:hypothetical protein
MLDASSISLLNPFQFIGRELQVSFASKKNCFNSHCVVQCHTITCIALGGFNAWGRYDLATLPCCDSRSLHRRHRLDNSSADLWGQIGQIQLRNARASKDAGVDLSTSASSDDVIIRRADIRANGFHGFLGMRLAFRLQMQPSLTSSAVAY